MSKTLEQKLVAAENLLLKLEHYICPICSEWSEWSRNYKCFECDVKVGHSKCYEICEQCRQRICKKYCFVSTTCNKNKCQKCHVPKCKECFSPENFKYLDSKFQNQIQTLYLCFNRLKSQTTIPPKFVKLLICKFAHCLHIEPKLNHVNGTNMITKSSDVILEAQPGITYYVTISFS